MRTLRAQDATREPTTGLRMRAQGNAMNDEFLIRCWYCGKQLADPPDRGKSPNMRTLDHLLPQSRGGGNETANLVDACWPCNAGKRSKTLEEYREYLYAKTAVGLARKHALAALAAWPEMP